MKLEFSREIFALLWSYETVNSKCFGNDKIAFSRKKENSCY